MTQFQTHYNRSDHKTKEEVNTMESMTIPDQSFSVEEIYRRFTQGRPLNIERQPIYDGEVLLPNYQTLDLADKEQLRKDVVERVKMLQKDYKTLKTQYDAKQAQKKQQSNAKPTPSEKPTEDNTQTDNPKPTA